MKFNVNGPSFIKIANTIIKGISPKDTQSQTIFSIIEEEGVNYLLMQSRSQTSFFKGKIAIESITNSSNDTNTWAVDGNQLKSIISVLPKYDTSLTFNMSNSNRQFEVVVSGNTFKLPVFEAPSFISEEAIEELATVSAHDFNYNISNLMKLVSADIAVQEHPSSCLNLFVKAGHITHVAANRSSIVEVKQELVDFVKEATILIKNAQASLLINPVSNPNSLLRLIVTKTMFGYTDEDNTLCLVSKANISPLEYEAFLHIASSEEVVTVNKEDFKYTIDSLSKLYPISDELSFSFKDNIVETKNDNNDIIKFLFEGSVEECEMKLLKPTLSVISGLLTDKFNMTWPKSSKKLVRFQLLDSENNVVGSTFIGVVING